MRILVVAEGTTGEALASRLQADGHHVDTTGSGQDAIDRAREQQYLTYFVNFKLGGMEGVEIMKEIFRVQPEATIIVTCRGHGTSEDEFVALAQKADSGPTDGPVPISLAEMEKRLIIATLRRTRGHITDSAAILGIDRSTLYQKIKKYEIPW